MIILLHLAFCFWCSSSSLQLTFTEFEKLKTFVPFVYSKRQQPEDGRDENICIAAGKTAGPGSHHDSNLIQGSIFFHYKENLNLKPDFVWTF